MLVDMKNALLLCLLTPALLFSFTINAALYKGIDNEGNVVYSDKPFENAELITPPPLTVVTPIKIKPKAEPIVEEAPVDAEPYTKFNILSPKDNATIWNNPNPSVTLQVTPALNTNEGHNIWLLLDGNPLIKNNRSLSIPLGRLDRGSHIIQAQLKNKAGDILKSSNSVTLHIKNSVIPKKTPRTN